MHIIIIGANAAGMSTAAKAQRSLKDSKVTVYEATESVSFGSCGLPYYIGGHFHDAERMVARPADKILESGINLKLNHKVTKLDIGRKELTIQPSDGPVFTDNYDKLVIATGASPIAPPLEKIDLDNIFLLRDLADGDKIKAALGRTGEEAVIIGGGFIGLELAEAFRKQNKNVRVIELEDRLMKHMLDGSFSEMISEEMGLHGVKLNTGEKVTGFKGETSVEAVVTDTGEYPAHLVVLSTGVRPNTAFLSETEIERLPNGAVIVNGYGETSVEDIYAAGDCAAVVNMKTGLPVYSPLATAANKLGRIIGENMGEKERPYPGTLNSSCVKIFDLEVGRTGLLPREIDSAGMGVKSVLIKDKNQTDYYPGQEDILIKLTFDEETQELLAAQCAGKNGAVLRIDVLAMAIQMKAKVQDLAMADLCYAPPFARTWDVINTAGNVAFSRWKKLTS